jgi:hypothetical protein
MGIEIGFGRDPGGISSLLVLSADVRLGVKNASSAKIRPRRAAYGPKTRDKSYETTRP